MSNMESPTPSSSAPISIEEQHLSASIQRCCAVFPEESFDRSALAGVSLPCKPAASVVSSQSRFENVSLSNSTNVMFGDKTFYQGPVTINQFHLSKSEEIRCNSENAHGSNATPNATSPSSKGSKTKSLLTSIVAGRCHPERKMILILTGTILVGLTVLLSIIGVLASSAHSDLSHAPELPVPSEGPTPVIDTDQSQNDSALRIISRAEWMAQPPEEPPAQLELPVSIVIIGHTAGGACSNQKDCSYYVQNIQSYHINTRGWGDIAFNFLVGGDGAIYEGRGWDKQGTHTVRYNSKSICITFMGNFMEKTPPARQINAAIQLLAKGQEKHKLTADYRLFGQRQLIATESPGMALYNVIRKWPHWSDKIS